MSDIISPLTIFPIAVIAATLYLAFKEKMYLVHSLIISNVLIFIFFRMALELTPAVLAYNVTIPFYLDMVYYPEINFQGYHLAGVFLSMFAHRDFMHIIGNMLFLFLLGPVLEERVGKGNFLVIYIMAGFGGSIFFTLLQCCGPALGASGAISGIVGAIMALYPREKVRMPIPLGPIMIFRQINATLGGFIFLAYQTVFALYATHQGSMGIAYSAHIGGFIFGMAFAPLIVARDSKVKRESQPRKRQDYSALELLATTESLQKILERIKHEDEPEVLEAWLEDFAAKTQCPQCGSPLSLEGRGIACAAGCGFKARV